ncbi:MAG TPA: hypothetical protein VEG44_01770 [Candidatus Acidoferrales bacterium]|nr:hypothetical protein [Candidatus Acidoferrales bacterium]
MWHVRNPVFAPKDTLKQLEKWWRDAAIKGAILVERDNRIRPIMDNEDDPMHDDFVYVYSRGRSDRK